MYTTPFFMDQWNIDQSRHINSIINHIFTILSLLCLIEHYRDIQWADSFENKQTLERYERWYHAWKSLECVKATRKTDTITNEQYEPKLIKKYERYAKNTAKTLVADAVNKGTAMP
eukprot:669255_1